MASGHFVRCDSCDKTVFKEEEANGWFILKTLLTKEPEVELPEDFNPFDEEQVKKVQEDARSKLPPAISGELCSVRCLMNFVGGHYNLEEVTDGGNWKNGEGNRGNASDGAI